MAEVKAVFGADDAQLQAAIKRSQSSLSRLGTDLRKGVNDFGKWGAAAVAAGAALSAAIYTKNAQNIDALAKLSRALGGTTEGLQALSRAASRAGISESELQGATTRLNQSLGEAMLRSGNARSALERLGLTAQDLSKMDIDERMATLANRFQDLGMSTQEVGITLRDLGIRQASMITLMQDGGAAIEDSRRKIDQYGVALNQIQTARVEAANDAFNEVRIVVSGLAEQITTHVAPIVTALSERFTEAAVEAGGVGSMAEAGFQKAVKAAGVLADILHGVRVALKTVQLGFQAVGSAAAHVGLQISKGWSLLIAEIADRIRALVEMVNRIPSINIPTDGLDRFADGMRGAAASMEDMQAVAVNAVKDVASELHELAMQEMPSQALSRFVEEVTEKANQAASAVIEARQSMTGGEAGGMSEEERKALEDRLEAVKQAMLSEQEVMAQKYAQDHETLVAALENELTTREEFEALMLARAQEYQAALSEIEQKASDQRAKITEDERRMKSDAMRKAFGDLSTLMNSGSRKLFEIGKAAATASALIDARAAIVGAYKVGARIGGPPLGIAYGAAAGAAQFSQIAAIQRQTFNSKGGGGASITESVNAQSVPVGGQSRSVSIDLGITGGSDRDRAVAGSVIAQLNDEIARGGRIAGLSLR
jgi:hypothetical protein